MDNNYNTIFEISYFSNGVIYVVFGFLAGGVIPAILGFTKIGRIRERNGGFAAIVFLRIWCVFWYSLTLLALAKIGYNTYVLQSALQNGTCVVTEGVVHVLRVEPKSGHGLGDQIMIGDQVFEYSYFEINTSYQQTIMNDGVLIEGALVRLHHLNGRIAKVEVARK